MSEETKKTAPAAEAEQQPAAAPEATAEQAAPAQEPAAEEAADPKDDKKKDGGWFNKKAREMEAVKAKLDAAEQNAAQAKEQLLRMAAEYDNYRKRSQKEKESAWADARAETVVAFLPVYDNLERALKQETADDAYKKGVEMTMTGLKEILSKLGVEEIPALGETFDPNLHNAVMHVEDDDASENTIVEVFQTGFQSGGKVIRFAMVKVAN